MAAAPSVTALSKTVLTGAAMQAKLVTEMGKALAEVWGAFDEWYNDDSVDEAARLAAEAEAKALSRIQDLADASARTALAALGITAKPGEIERAYPRIGVSALEVWRRPAEQYRFAISQGKTEPDALVAALDRADHIARTDAALAARDTKLARLRQNRSVIGYRRIIHPELSASGTCGLCIVAADRIYEAGDLMPLHDGCQCDVMPVTRAWDPGLSLNELDLKRIYKASGSTSATDLARLRIQSVEHGELGPVLVQVGKTYTTPEDALKRKRVRTSPSKKTGSTGEPSILELGKRADSSTTDLTDQEWKRLIAFEQSRLDSYQAKVEQMRASGIANDDPRILGTLYGRRRIQNDLARYERRRARAQEAAA